MIKDLHIEIPKRFKKGLKERFTLKNAKYDKNRGRFFIEKGCPLCFEYRVYSGCSNCPFNQKYGKFSCSDWIGRVIGSKYGWEHYMDIITVGTKSIHWLNKNDKEAREMIKTLRKEAKKYIQWR